MVGKLADQYVTERRKMGRMTPATAQAVQRRLWHFARAVNGRPPESIRTRDVEKWVHDERLAPLTRKCRLTTIRPFWRWMLAKKLVTHDPTIGVESPKVPPLAPRAIPLEEARQLVVSTTDPRSRLIVLLMLQEGLRCCEVARAELSDVDLGRRIMGVRGKGGQGGVTRHLPVSDETAAALRAYIDSERGAVAGPLVMSRRDPNSRIGAHYISKLVHRTMVEAGIKRQRGDGRSAHACRHTALTDMVDQGADLLTVQHAAGHADVNTTRRWYLRGVTPDLRVAMAGRSYCRQHT